MPITRNIQTKDDNPITSLRYILVCPSGKEICEHVEEFVSVKPSFPPRLVCGGFGVEDFQTVSLPLPGDTTYIYEINGQTYVGGQTYSQTLANTVTSLTIKSISPCAEEIFLIQLPSIASCLREPVVTDPCNCDRTKTYNNTEYFLETLTLPSSDLANIYVKNFTGSIINPNTGAFINNNQELTNLITGNTLSFYVLGTYSVDVEGTVIGSASNEKVLIKHGPITCQGPCADCDFTVEPFNVAEICANTGSILVPYRSNNQTAVTVTIESDKIQNSPVVLTNQGNIGNPTVQLTGGLVPGTSFNILVTLQAEGCGGAKTSTLPVTVISPPTCEGGGCGSVSNQCGTVDCGSILQPEQCAEPDCTGLSGNQTVTVNCTQTTVNSNGEVCGTETYTKQITTNCDCSNDCGPCFTQNADCSCTLIPGNCDPSDPNACAPGFECANCQCQEIIGAVLGCTDSSALNYNPNATQDDGSCEYCDGINIVVQTGCGNNATAELISINGQTPGSGYSWQWSNGTTQTTTTYPVGVHTITVTDPSTGCTETETFAIDSCACPNITININQTGDACPSPQSFATLTATASGGAGGYNYSWSHGPNGAVTSVSTAGNYTVVVTDSDGCTGTANISVGESCPCVPPAVQIVGPSCALPGQSINLNATVTGGTGPFTFSWTSSNGQTITGTQNTTAVGPGNYTVVVTDGCNPQNSVSETITVDECNCSQLSANPTLQGGDCVPTGGSIIALSNPSGSGPFTYQWTTTNGNISGSSTNENVVATSAGTYQIQLTDACGNTTIEEITITECSVGCTSGCADLPTGITVNIGAGDIATFDINNYGTPANGCSWEGLASFGCGNIGPNNPVNVGINNAATGQTASTCTVLVNVTDTDDLCGPNCGPLTVSPEALCLPTGSTTEIFANANGTAPLTYTWSDGSNQPSLVVSSPGVYSVTVTDACGSTVTGSITIEECCSGGTEVGLEAYPNSATATTSLTTCSPINIDYSWIGAGLPPTGPDQRWNIECEECCTGGLGYTATSEDGAVSVVPPSCSGGPVRPSSGSVTNNVCAYSVGDVIINSITYSDFVAGSGCTLAPELIGYSFTLTTNYEVTAQDREDCNCNP